ncbi:MAG TPA: MarR family transcriptional regulator [Candidatus Dormibacteraeota bacterium]|nr:MarR family transcriptional regulator [Candidatus Dormibacteraeota bacterium]
MGTRAARARPVTTSAVDEEATDIAASLDAIGKVMRRSAWDEARKLPVALTPPQLLAMQTLVEAAQPGLQSGDQGAEGLSLSALSARIGLAHSTTSGIVDRLERLGLVRRVTRPDDRRFAIVQLADAVAAWVRHDLPSRKAAPLSAALQRAAPEERTAIREGLATLERLLSLPAPDPK